MAEIVKAKKRQNLVNYEEKEEKVEKKSTKKSPKKEKKAEESKKSVWQHIMIFFNGVKSETKKVRWTSKTDMVKYSVATIVFILFCSLFFYGIDTIFALIQSLFK